MTKPSWLPDALRYSDFEGDWDSFLAKVYEIFECDFKKSRPCYNGTPISYDSTIEDGKESVFWHIISSDDPVTGKREVDFRRCERIPWPRPIIEHSTDKEISVWKNQRKKPHSPRQTRILIWLENLDYIVILAVRTKSIVLVTAYCTDIERQREKLKKERDDFYKMQKSPFRTT